LEIVVAKRTGHESAEAAEQAARECVALPFLVDCALRPDEVTAAVRLVGGKRSSGKAEIMITARSTSFTLNTMR
jgi:hypothetical protein